jgi:hypothetical protein
MAPVGTKVGTTGGHMLFAKGTTALSILNTTSEGEVVVVLNMQ